VDDRTVAAWDPRTGCSLGIEKRLREGRARRDQAIVFDLETGVAHVEDPKIKEKRFDVGPCPLDVLSGFFVARVRGVPEKEPLVIPIFDNGRPYTLGFRVRRRERVDLPPPFGGRVPTVVIEPQLVAGTGLFATEGRLTLWVTDDARRIPVRFKAKVAVGSVAGHLEEYHPGEDPSAVRPAPPVSAGSGS
jgi:hypothetical protein